MEKLSEKENRLIKVFLTEYKKLVQTEINIPFNPRNLTIVSQPDLKDNNRFDYVSYNQWFDEAGIEAYIGTGSLLQSFLEIPIQILISAEELGKSLLSKKDQKKILKALKLLSDIRIERQK